MFEQKVVVRFKDGRTLAGFGDSFLAGEAEILVQDLGERIHRVLLQGVKMVCFVRDFASDPAETHRLSGKVLFQAVPGNRVRVAFRDGEVLEGITNLESRPTRGFFLTPLNPHGNNLSVYVNMDEVVSFRFLD
ncbi:MAG: DUF6982 domain-containing protein [Acidobacteriota bacterium]